MIKGHILTELKKETETLTALTRDKSSLVVVVRGLTIPEEVIEEIPISRKAKVTIMVQLGEAMEATKAELKEASLLLNQ